MKFGTSEVSVYDSIEEGSTAVADEIAQLIRSKPKCTLGLATGSSPILVYSELVKRHKAGLSFAGVTTYNLDEYYPIERANDQSYYYFMHDHLFNHVDIAAGAAHIPDGTVTAAEVDKFCAEYESGLTAAGIDLQLLGIGQSGHIGFNEPGSGLDSVTRCVTLADVTRRDAAPAFGGIEKVPTTAISMGVGSILKAKRIVVLAWGAKKAAIVARAIKEAPSADCPVTFLKQHGNVKFVVDKALFDKAKELLG